MPEVHELPKKIKFKIYIDYIDNLNSYKRKNEEKSDIYETSKKYKM